MVMTDPIADMLTRIRNANMVRHEKLEVPASKIKKEIAEILKREGFVRDVELYRRQQTRYHPYLLKIRCK